MDIFNHNIINLLINNIILYIDKEMEAYLIAQQMNKDN